MPDTHLPPDTLPEDAQEQLAFLMATGRFATEVEAVAAAIKALAEQEREFDDFLRREVLPVYEEAQAHPERLIPAEEVFARLRAKHARRAGE